MTRRELFRIPAGCSLAYLAAEPLPARGVEEIRRGFDRIAPPGTLRRMAQGERNMTLVELDCDVLVAGGGMAGVCAAIAAARHGARVVLVQDRSRLGGNASSEVKMHIVGADSHTARPGWREGGLIEEFRLADAANNPQRCFELWDALLYDKVVSEPNITLLLESTLYAAAVKNGRIREALVRCDKSEHLYRIRARIFIDATGDSRLALEAGAEMRWGREARAEFEESLAPVDKDGETLGSSILFTSRQHRRPMPFTPPAWARKIGKDQLLHRRINSWEYGYWWIEWGGNFNPIRDNERIRFELLSIVMGIWDYIKNSGEFPSSSDFALDWIGMMPGKRGSRRVIGDHILTQHDLMNGGNFDDAVAIGGWPMDDHPPGGFDRPDLPPNTALRPPEVYNIPLRSLYSRNVANLMLAGRNISASHVAFTSSRVMATCAVIGQAAGAAASMCAAGGFTPRELYQRKDRLRELQQMLLRDDQTIRGLRNEDPLDLARSAKAAASEGDAALALDGWTRDIPKKEIHHWQARMGPEGAWLELAWEQPQRIREVQIAFDSGFQRQLTLSAQDATSRTCIRAPQPEIVRDYTLTCGDRSIPVRGNIQRINRHRFEPVEARSLRIHVEATHGDDFARIFEVRCYA